MTVMFRHLIAPLAFALCVAAPALAEDLPAPTGDILLTVTGAISVMNQGDAAVFDLDMLKAVGEVTFKTTTPWTEGEQSFTGVPLEALMQAVGVAGGTLTAKAINDYAIEIPVSDAVADGPIIAYLQNGDPMSVREKGPLWVVYPYDLKEDYQAEVIYSRSIWQLTNIDVKAE
jgi:hypothetical protein